MKNKNPYEYVKELSVPEGTDAQKKLRIAFVELLLDNNPADISVQKLCKKADVGRTTFYSHYQNTDDLLNEIENEFIQGLVRHKNGILMSSDMHRIDLDFFVYSYEYTVENREIVKALLIRHSSIRFHEKWKRVIKCYYIEKFCIEDISERNEYFLEIASVIIIRTYVYYLEKDFESIPKESIETVLDAIHDMLER